MDVQQQFAQTKLVRVPRLLRAVDHLVLQDLRWRQVTPPSQDSPFELCRFYPIFSDAQTGRVFLLIEWIPLFRHHNMLEGLEYPRLRIPGEMPSRKRSKPRLMICRSISERLLYEIILR